MKITSRQQNLIAVALVGALAFTTPALWAEEAATTAAPEDAAAKAQELAKKLSNPIANLISAPMQANFDEDFGPDGNGSKFTLNIQPVIPVSLGEDWNVISRTILPVIYQSDIVGTGSQGGLGDITQSLFFSPKEPTKGGVIWGAGPALLLPSATRDELGTEKWAAGPTVVMLKQTHGWTYGLLANHLWSYAGNDDRADVNATFLQPFLSFTTKQAMTFSLNTEATYNWDADHDQWSIPVNFAVSQLMRIGKQPVQLQGGLGYWADSPQNGAEGFRFRFAVTLLFPKDPIDRSDRKP
jgi:hypothetical protein